MPAISTGERLACRKKEPDDYRYWDGRAEILRRLRSRMLHHQHFNPHHWQHLGSPRGRRKTKYLEMPDNFCAGDGRRLVRSWPSDNRKVEVWKWYEKNRERIMLHQATRDVVDTLIEIEQAEMDMEHVGQASKRVEQ